MTLRAAADARLDRIRRLLDQEREALLGGALDALAGLVARREALVAEIVAAPEPPPAAPLAEIRARAARNAGLIEAAIAGVKSAAATIARIDAATGVLRTYSAEGVPVEVVRARVTRDTRA